MNADTAALVSLYGKTPRPLHRILADLHAAAQATESTTRAWGMFAPRVAAIDAMLANLDGMRRCALELRHQMGGRDRGT